LDDPHVFDVAIVGARVAGTVLGTLLGEAGYRVLIVDSTTFPSDTISTHFFRGAGLGSVLVRLGLLEEVLERGAPPLTHQLDFAAEDVEPTVSESQDPGDLGYGLSVRRVVLDQLLVDRARAVPGVVVLEGAQARSLLWDGDRVAGLMVEHAGTTREIQAQIVIGADGRRSAVARWVDAAIERRETATRALYYRYVRGFDRLRPPIDAVEFSLAGDELAYIFPSDSALACVAVSINLETFAAFRGTADEQFDRRIASHAGIAGRYSASAKEGRLLGSGPVDALIRKPSGLGWALVGDAAMNQDPWTGLGMDNAAIHATFLADAIIEWLSGGSDEATALAGYRERRDEHALAGFDFTAEIGRDLRAMAGD
jgi:flavin-dependent dehydrogenase